MKKLLHLLLAICCICNLTKAQEPCGTKAPSEEWEQWFQTKIAERKADLASGRIQQTNYVIPVIVHIIHSGDDIGDGENISATKVQSQIDILNADFAGIGRNYGDYPNPSGWPSISYTGISFCLANLDKNGNQLLEPGIDRINWITHGWSNPNLISSNAGLYNYFNDTIKPNTIWDPKKYLNIWIADTKTSSSMVSGFAFFPLIGIYSFPITDIENEKISGVFVSKDWFGNGIIDNKGRTTTHEIGHYLGVRHIWGDTNCGNDECDDTPPAFSNNLNTNLSCPDYPYHINSCSNPSGNYPNGNAINGEMFMNFMDYGADRCRYMFTPDQATRMQTVMQYGTYRAPLAYSPACGNPMPDLIVIAPQVAPNIVNAGDVVSLTFAEDNQGGASAAPNFVNIHISKDTILTPGINGDRYLEQYNVNQTLFPLSQTILLYKFITIPYDLTPGIYYIFLAADGTGAVNEYTEDNNFVRIPITITNSSTNCINANFSISPTTNWQNHSSSHNSNGNKIYKVPVVSGNVYTFKTGCGNGATANYDTYLDLYKTNCTTIKVNDDSCESARSAISLTSNFTGDAYLKVSGYGSQSGNYTLAYQYHTCTGWNTVPSSKTFTFNGGNGTFNTYSNIGGCSFTAVNNNPTWIKNITATANGVISYSVDANYGAARTGTISIKDINNVTQFTYYVYQDQGYLCRTCPSYDYTITPTPSWQTTTNNHITNGCKIYRAYVTAGYIYSFKTGCNDGATANYDTYLELLNSSCSRITNSDDDCESQRSSLTWKATFSGYVYLKINGFAGAGGNFTLAYKYNECSNWQINPTSETFLANGGSNTFNVTTQYGGCGYYAVSNDYWINNVEGLDGGVVNYNVDINPDASRTGTISIKDDYDITQRTFTVYQNAGSVCTTCPSYDVNLNPITNWQTHTSNHGSNGCKLYRIPVSTGKIYTFKTGCDDGATADYDTYLALYDNNCNLISYNDDSCIGNKSIINWSSNYTGFAYLKVLGYNNAFGNYTMAYKYITCTNPTQPTIILGNTTACENSTQTYTVNQVSGATEYIWTLPTGWIGNSTSNSITVTTGNINGTISVIAKNDCGTSIARSLSVIINKIPTKPTIINGNSNSICQSSSQVFSINPVANATNYTWELPFGWVGNSTTTSINTTVGNSGTIYVTANNNCGNSIEQSLFVDVNPLPQQSSSIIGSLNNCQESISNYSIPLDPDATNYTWSWPVGWDLNFGQNTNEISLKTGANSGQVCVTPSNSCGFGIQKCKYVQSYLLPNQPIINGTSTPIINSNTNYSISNVNATSVNWTVPNGWIINSGQGTSTINVKVGSSSGQICAIVTNPCGTSSQGCLTLSTITNNINNNLLNNFNIYPNPNNGEFTLEVDLQKSGNCEIRITNMLGQIIYEETKFITNTKNKIPIQLSNIVSGAYNVNLIIDTENYSKQIIITK